MTAILGTAIVWTAGLDGSVLLALALSLSWRYIQEIRTGGYARARAGHQLALVLALFLFVLLSVSTIIWDTAHSNLYAGAQFPYALRMVATIPALVLASYGLFWLFSQSRNKSLSNDPAAIEWKPPVPQHKRCEMCGNSGKTTTT